MAIARELDVVITKIMKATVKYTLFIGGRAEEWRIPNASTFNTARLEEGKRYKVWTAEIWSDEYNFRKGHNERVQRYDWVSVQEKNLYDKRTDTKTAKQSAASKALAAMPIVGEGELFSFPCK
jgi:hypothetical protein